MEHVSKPTPSTSGPAPSSSGLGHGVLSPLTLALVSCGGVGALLFTVTYLLEGITRPGYDAWQQPISALSLGPGGWVQQVNFVVFGILLVLSAVGWYRVLTPERGAIWFPVLQGISGLCLMGAGVFSMDPFPGYPPGAALPAATVHGTLHTLFAWVLILALAQGCFTLGVFFVRLPHWRGWAVYSYVTGVLILVFWGLFVRNATGPLGGLVERLSAGSHALWLFALTATLVVQHRARSR
ncbi:MAG TPA: DUF998 domain-containing protein [Ktedonobacterales bacterium]